MRVETVEGLVEEDQLDRPEEDVAGALAAGLRAVLVARDGAPAAPRGVPVIRSLAELPRMCGYA